MSKDKKGIKAPKNVEDDVVEVVKDRKVKLPHVPKIVEIETRVSDLDSEIERLKTRLNLLTLSIYLSDEVVIPEIDSFVEANKDNTMIPIYNEEDSKEQKGKKGASTVDYHMTRLKLEKLLELRKTVEEGQETVVISLDFNKYLDDLE